MPKDQYLTKCCQTFPASFFRSGAPPATGALPRYELVRVLGGGSTGTVVLAKDHAAPEGEAATVAVKFVDLEGGTDDDRSRCLSEVFCLQQCSCFSILRSHCCFQYCSPSNPALVQSVATVVDYANSGDLRLEIKSRLKNQNPFREHEAGLIFLQLLIAVHHLHTKNILHRDIKTANVLLCSNGLVKLGDFGYSKQYKLPDESIEENVGGTFCGTPYYVAPEIWKRQKYSKMADMFSLGVVFYEMLSLRRPFEGEDLKNVMQQVLHKSPPPLPAFVGPDVQDIVSSLMEKSPMDRPDTSELLQRPVMKLFASALLQIAHSETNELAATDRLRVIEAIKELRLTARRRSSTSKSFRSDRSTDTSQAGSPRKDDRSSEEVGCDASSPKLQTNCEASYSFADSIPQPVALSSSSFSVQSEDYCIIKDGMLFKESGDCNWKKRYLCLFRNVNGVSELLLSTSRQSAEGQSIRKKLADFEDVFAVPDKYSTSETGNAFALMAENGKKLTFCCSTKEERDSWVEVLSLALHEVGIAAKTDFVSR